MSEINVGKFQLSFYDGGYPVKITLKHNIDHPVWGRMELSFGHKELMDLQYAIKKSNARC